MRTVSKNDSIHHIDNLAPMVQIKFTLGHFMSLKIRAKEEELYNLVKEIEARSEEHTSELQSRSDLVCRLLLEKKKKIK